jgi:hypothetical protein
MESNIMTQSFTLFLSAAAVVAATWSPLSKAMDMDINQIQQQLSVLPFGDPERRPLLQELLRNPGLDPMMRDMYQQELQQFNQ